MLVHRRFQHFVAGTHLYSWVKRSTVRVKYLAQEHNTVIPARARTRSPARYRIRNIIYNFLLCPTLDPEGGDFGSIVSVLLFCFWPRSLLTVPLTTPYKYIPVVWARIGLNGQLSVTNFFRQPEQVI